MRIFNLLLLIFIIGCKPNYEPSSFMDFPKDEESSKIVFWNKDFNYQKCTGDKDNYFCQYEYPLSKLEELERKFNLLVESMGYEYQSSERTKPYYKKIKK